MPQIDIQVSDKRYYLKKVFLKTFCRRVIKTAWDYMKAYRPAEVSLVLANDVFITELNRDYRGKNNPTNVLSFETAMKPVKGQPFVAGDIIVAYETVAREAAEQGKSFEAHLAHLLIHGTLHLLGEDHLTDKQANKMEAKEIKIMKQLGYDNPYREKI
ncbi:MAG: rRNA maturation RNase YbeY [Alphaproteobacteria bacterium]|nr:rRNA maturation RNase YbeY [Alphaproteobacteria bacterium]